MTQPNYLHPDWPYTGPPCDFVPSEHPTSWRRLLQVQTAAATLHSLSNQWKELDRQRYVAGNHTFHAVIAELQKDAGKHRAALAAGAPPSQPPAETVAAAKALLADACDQLPKPGDNTGGHDPDPWHTAIFEMLRADALMTAAGSRRDEYQAAGPEAATAWRQTMDILAHQCRHHDAELQRQAGQTPAGAGRRARRRLLAQATGASRSARHTYHEAVAGPRRNMPLRYGKQAQEIKLRNLLGSKSIYQVAAADAAPVIILHLETDTGAESDPILIIEHRSELHVLLDIDTMPPGLPAASLLESHLPQQLREAMTEDDDSPTDAEPPNWFFRMTALLAAAAAGIHDARPEALLDIGNTIRAAVNADPHAIAILEDAVEDHFGYYLGGWISMQCRLVPKTTDERNQDNEDEEPPFFTPEQNHALLTSGAAAGISPYGLKRLAVAIGADTQPGYIDRLPANSRQATAAVHAAIRQAIPDQPHISQPLAQILETELGIDAPGS